MWVLNEFAVKQVSGGVRAQGSMEITTELPLSKLLLIVDQMQQIESEDPLLDQTNLALLNNLVKQNVDPLIKISYIGFL